MSVKKLLHLNDSGVLQNLPPGSIVDIGGTSNANFTVGGIGVVLSDGSTSGGGSLTLQTIYDSSSDSLGNAAIKLLTGKDLIVYDDTDNTVYFKIDSRTGKVTITGDLEVLGTASEIQTTIQSADHWTVSPASPAVTAIRVEPKFGTPLVDLVNIRNVLGGAPVFRIDKDGNTNLTNLNVSGNLILNGTVFNASDISGVITGNSNLSDALNALSDAFHLHITTSPTVKHAATEISVRAPAFAPGAKTVQDVVDAFQFGNTSQLSMCVGFEYKNPVPSEMWEIIHNANTERVHIMVYDGNNEVIFPDRIRIANVNTVEVFFTTPQDGKAVLVLF